MLNPNPAQVAEEVAHKKVLHEQLLNERLAQLEAAVLEAETTYAETDKLFQESSAYAERFPGLQEQLNGHNRMLESEAAAAEAEMAAKEAQARALPGRCAPRERGLWADTRCAAGANAHARRRRSRMTWRGSSKRWTGCWLTLVRASPPWRRRSSSRL